jgi:hypothetical protein
MSPFSLSGLLTYSGGALGSTTSDNPQPFQDVIGDGFLLTAIGFAGSVSYVTFSLPTVYTRVDVSPTSGYDPQTVSGQITEAPDPTTGAATFGGYLPKDPASYIFSATIYYTDTSLNPSMVSITVTANKPGSNIIVTNNGFVPHIVTNPTRPPTYTVEAGAGLGATVTTASISFQATVDPALIGASGGSFFFVQTMNPYTVTESHNAIVMALGVKADKSAPRPLVDTQDPNGWTFQGSGQGNPGTTLTAVDSPGNFGPLDNSYESYSYYVEFSMYLMFVPNGGVAVPLGLVPWSMHMFANYDSTSRTWSAGGEGVEPTNPSYSETTSYPSWTGNIAQLSRVGWVQIAP